MVEVSKPKRFRKASGREHAVSTGISNLEELDEISLNDDDRDDHYHFHIYNPKSDNELMSILSPTKLNDQGIQDLEQQQQKNKKQNQDNEIYQERYNREGPDQIEGDNGHHGDNTDDEEEVSDDADDQYSYLDKWTFFLVWYGLAIVSHFCKGGHTAFAQYLKSEDSVAPPAFSLVALGNLFVLFCYSPRIVQKCVRFYRQSQMELPSSASTTTGHQQTRHQELEDVNIHAEEEDEEEEEAEERNYEQQRLSSGTTPPVPSFLSSVIAYWKPAVTHPAAYIFILAIILRSFARGQALNFTKAIFIQLIELMSPFLITFISIRMFRHRERADWPTITTLIVTCLGSVALILGQSTNHEQGFHWFPNFANVVKQVTWSHLIGFAIAFVGAFSLAVRTLTIDYITVNEHVKLSCENMFLVEKMSLCLAFLPLSFVFGDFNQFGAMGWQQWSIFFLTSFLNDFVGSFLSIFCTAKLGGSTYGVMLPIRLLSTVIVSMVLLGEIVNNFWEILGFSIIAISLASYMTWKKNKGKSRSKKDQSLSSAMSSQRPLESMAPHLTYSSRYRMEPFSNLKVENV